MRTVIYILVVCLLKLRVKSDTNLDDYPEGLEQLLENDIRNNGTEKGDETEYSDSEASYAATDTTKALGESDQMNTDLPELGQNNTSEENLLPNGNSNCDRPPVIDHATIAEDDEAPYTEGTVLTYACEFGFSEQGLRKTSQCVFSEKNQRFEWTEADIVCIPRSCGDPGFVLHGYRIGSVFTFPSKVIFECDEGYELSGNGIRYCQTSGSWSGVLPTCEKIFCEPPPHPVNGRVSYSSLEFGAELEYHCDAGYLLKNSEISRICSENGTWSEEEPTCQEAQCPPLSAPEFGSIQIIGGKSSIGSRAVFTCEEGRMLVGSATSKCLEIGDWTFPTPKCLEPCSAPKVLHGKIGRYHSERYTNKRRFLELKEGTLLGKFAELYLRCEWNYEPLGLPNGEEKIICDSGQWSSVPRCEPAMCRGNPTPTANAVVRNANHTHGGGVVYDCNKYYKKTAYGNVTCQHGTWRGPTPVCSDTRCYSKDFQFSGFRSNKTIFVHGQSFYPECEKGFSLSKPNKEESKLTCIEGKIQGHLPPCLAASCTTQPPEIENGYVKSSSGLHSSTVIYECMDQLFTLQKTSNVQCLFGEWSGTPPKCVKLGGCPFQNLKKSLGLKLDMNSVANDQEHLDIVCEEGYETSGYRPFCSRGEWLEEHFPCKEDFCSVPPLSDGEFGILVEKKWYKKAFSKKKTEFQKVHVNTWHRPGDRLYVSCKRGFTFQGKGSNSIQVTCTQGKWNPTPVCLINGEDYIESKSATDDTVPTNLPIEPTTNVDALTESVPDLPTPTTPALQEVTPQSTMHALQEVPPQSTMHPLQEVPPQSTMKPCFCKYRSSQAGLVAHAGKELLRNGAMVKDNCTVKFHCNPIGYYLLRGPMELKCTNCRDWKAEEYPFCTNPERGDTLIDIFGKHKILPGGFVEIERGQPSRFRCISNGVAAYPAWTYPNVPNIDAHYFLDSDEHNRLMYTAFIDIVNVDSYHAGRYSCSVNGYRERHIDIQVTDPVVKCPKFENPDLNISYDNEQNVNSSVLFQCKRSNEKIIGTSVLTCLPNGLWSGQVPECSIQCPEIPELPDGPEITYTKDLRVNSVAVFHCTPPRILKGVERTTCMRSGKWYHNTPSCTLPQCLVADLFERIPEELIADMTNITSEKVPYDFLVRLMCDRDLMLSGNHIARCGEEGIWEVSNVQCVPGCIPVVLPEASDLILEPPKEYYRFGEFVTLSCGPGKVLSSDVVKLMCLNSGWSESEIPVCVKEPEPDEK